MKKTVTTLVRIAFLGIFLWLILQGKMNLWLALFGVTVVGALFFGRFFCGYVCPMNTLMVPVDWITRKMGLKRREVPKFLKGQAGAAILLVLSVAILVLSKRFLGKNIPLLFVFLGIAVVVTIFYRPEFFHNHLCPFGLVQSWTGRFARLSKKVSMEDCIGCKKCEKVCPSAAIAVDPENRKARIDATLCHQCQNCTVICPVNAISYGKR
ncbi:4Fe-4S binding protein [Alkalibacter rhizosphaerae]|uniref:4Fe-4S binding protein n=1 Tax=Alkalibacter rhizosphaerae TaxID=2815577 RepID=A0A975AGH6_9FIRM|nr:4Fe-4S binding protein [Alkalibacter rhizosphaerae]QSX07549.1 4Fe-4S binding protein [Alkalibacter rhizosphaerae]